MHLGLDWHITTRVIRLSREATAISLKVPLIKNESITSSHIHSENGYALVHMKANQASIEWQSLLSKSAQINLVAPATSHEPTLVQYGIFKAREFQPYIIKIKPEIGYQNGGLGQMKVLL